VPRIVRYQGAIVRDHHILLIKLYNTIKRRGHWLVPGGGREDGETEEQCVRREMREETHLDVAVERLLLDEPGNPGGIYQRYKTYLCRPIAGEARPGCEPEPEAARIYIIQDVRWLDLQDETAWGLEVTDDPITYPLLQRIQSALGYDYVERNE
jgi:8-oxo-dGTP pyrophosphatase MutT (NUDIX family)